MLGEGWRGGLEAIALQARETSAATLDAVARPTHKALLDRALAVCTP